MMEIKFKRDTSFRKQFFVPDSFAHPAKMDSQLLIWIVEHYTEGGETILDPMAGSGTSMLACTLGRDVILVELENKFCKMMRDNWEQVKMRPQLGSTMGTCEIIQGDARQLEGLVDKIVTSPPFAGNKGGLKSAESFAYGNDTGLGKRMMGGIKGGTGSHPDNIDSLPYGEIDKIVTSPPYEGIESRDRSIESSFREGQEGIPKRGDVSLSVGYSKNSANIGNLKSDSYLEAMLLVYKSCFAVLRDGGLMILVVKPFIRNQKLVPLQEDTKRLCEQAGFVFVEEHHRILPSQSFWRVIYAKRFPNAPKIDCEFVLVFKKDGGL